MPRHEQIVGRILGDEYSRSLTLIIGFFEIGMALWILSRYKSKLNAYVQMTIVVIMNVLEFILVPDLLLWGKSNLIFAILFIILVYYNEFILSNKSNQPIKYV